MSTCSMTLNKLAGRRPWRYTLKRLPGGAWGAGRRGDHGRNDALLTHVSEGTRGWEIASTTNSTTKPVSRTCGDCMSGSPQTRRGIGFVGLTAPAFFIFHSVKRPNRWSVLFCSRRGLRRRFPGRTSRHGESERARARSQQKHRVGCMYSASDRKTDGTLREA